MALAQQLLVPRQVAKQVAMDVIQQGYTGAWEGTGHVQRVTRSTERLRFGGNVGQSGQILYSPSISRAAFLQWEPLRDLGGVP